MMNTVTILMILIIQACLGITGEDMGAVIDVVSACLNNHSLPCLFTPQETLAIGHLAVPTEENIHIKILCIIVILNNYIYIYIYIATCLLPSNFSMLLVYTQFINRVAIFCKWGNISNLVIWTNILCLQICFPHLFTSIQPPIFKKLHAVS